jgi:hypothetical protein
MSWHPIAKYIVAEPEPVKRQLFAGAGAEVFWAGSGYVNSHKMLRKALNFSYLNLKFKYFLFQLFT